MSHSNYNTEAAPLSLFQRVVTLLWQKAIGSTVMISAFFVAYFYVLKHPFSETFILPMLAPDSWMPLIPSTAWIYFSLWVYICLPSSLMCQVNELADHLMGAALLSVFGLAIFYFLPTAVPSWEIDWDLYPPLGFLKSSDASGNACPSLHVAFSIYTGLWMVRMLRILRATKVWFYLNWLWCVLIVLSTMSTKQHVFVDVVCGTALGLLVFYLNERIARKAKFAAFSSKSTVNL